MAKVLKNLSHEQQAKIVNHVAETFTFLKDKMSPYMSRMTDVHKEYSTFKEEKESNRQTVFKVNKAHEVVNKAVPRIMSKPPKWIVSVKEDDFDDEDEDTIAEKLDTSDKHASMVQDLLTYTFAKQDLIEVMRLAVKNSLKYGNVRGKICHKYNIARVLDKTTKKSIDEEWNEIEEVEDDIRELVVDDYTTIEVKKYTDVYYDPRYVRFEDMPYIIDVTENVRLSYFMKNKKYFMNLDKLKDVCNTPYQDAEWYKKSIESLTGISWYDGLVDKNKLSVKTYYGLFDLEWDDGEGERLYEFQTVADLVLVCAKEITQIPFEDMKCFDDTESFYAVGLVEPMLGLQKELNFKKNSASEYINHALNRTYIWSPNSWLDPRKSKMWPGAILMTTKSWKDALENFVELPHRQIPAEYFQEQNDLERQIQAATFTIDTTTPKSNQWLTQTATGIRVKEFETNSVMEELRKHFEEFMVRLAYKFLQEMYENMWEFDNLTIKKTDGTWKYKVHREALAEAIKRFDIQIEVWSSSRDSIEQRREDALAQWNIALAAANAWVAVDLDEQYKRLMKTFEGINENKLLKQPNPMQALGMWWGVPLPQQTITGQPV